MSEQEPFDAAQVDSMALIETIGVIENPIVVVDAVFLDVGVGTFPLDRRIAEVRGGHGKAAEGAVSAFDAELQELILVFLRCGK